ncbi:hypothetical protein CDL15_Pgr007661 [Punica granatum]|uniref:Uncharacterized protein n=1 Tax=Punica granatum TaxID=22663 RepID=A0A218X9L3_PUNGR|nr:hypothetical protein CDL15_Pgr007661 [Punica granatum]PKI40956.1 hypothetical protein CRG98_038484 [Punica granatum]
MEEIAVVLNKFGDEQSTLLDQFERLSFEARLNQAILGRSLSEPSTIRPNPLQGAMRDSQPQEGGRHHRQGIRKVLKKLLKPFLGRRSSSKTKKGAVADYSKSNPSPITNPNPIPVYSKAFSRSLRF